MILHDDEDDLSPSENGESQPSRQLFRTPLVIIVSLASSNVVISSRLKSTIFSLAVIWPRVSVIAIVGSPRPAS